MSQARRTEILERLNTVPPFLVNTGKIDGVFAITLLAQKTDITTTEKTMWPVDGQDRYQLYTSAGVTNIVSDDANDSAAGTGIRTVKVSGIDNDYLFQQEVATLNGTTPVALTNQYLAVNEMNPETSGNTFTAQGNIDVLRGTDVLCRIQDSDNETNNISRQIVFTVPANSTFYVKKVEASSGSNDEVTIRLYANNPVNEIYVLQHTLLLFQDFVSSILDEWLVYPEKHLLEVTAQAALGTNRDASVLISGILVLDSAEIDIPGR